MANSDANSNFIGPQSCQPCHEEIYRSFIQTAHFRTSQVASHDTIKGSFAEGRNVLKTRNPSVYFKMEQRDDGFYQIGYQRFDEEIRTRSERFDLVTGSGRRGQTYLYWSRNRLFQLPVSYLAERDRWINSPGFTDGEIRFDRLIEPRCLECHATFFSVQEGFEYGNDYLLGVACEKCHGAGSKHVELHSARRAAKSGAFILNPRSLSREKKIAGCALCHSGPLTPKRPVFSYQPGQPLEDYFFQSGPGASAEPDVHGNQVALLRSSRCFVASAKMSCSTCHDVHKEQRNTALLAQKCMQCHQPRDCGTVRRVGERARELCVDCHMPKRTSQAVRISSAAESAAPSLRTHAIRIYPDDAKTVLKGLPLAPE
ncbi:MAG: hypothetical protein HY695_09070 [Deltaproteobacteria bacterium]|nr:hypothetical protein [Deltaproteobacteria bacterium]